MPKLAIKFNVNRPTPICEFIRYTSQSVGVVMDEKEQIPFDIPREVVLSLPGEIILS